MKHLQLYKSIAIIAVVAAAIITVNVVRASAVYPQVFPPGGYPTPSFLDISSMAQAKSGNLALGATTSTYSPASVLDVQGTGVIDVLGVLGESWITGHFKVGSTSPVFPDTDSQLYVQGSRIRSTILAGTGERTICADSLGRLKICNTVLPTPVPGTCGPDNTTTVSSLSSTDSGLCASGTVASFSGSGPWTWRCNGVNDPGQYAPCSANLTPPAPIYPDCGNYPGDLCLVGTASGVTMSPVTMPLNAPSDAVDAYNPTWTCTGSNGGGTITCSAPPTCTIPGYVLPGCFLPGTQITLADGTTKTIQSVMPGDQVEAANGQVNTVVNVIHQEFEGYVYGINGSKPFVTGMHPIMTVDGWKSFQPAITEIEEPSVKIVGALGIGDVLKKQGGANEALSSYTRTWMNTKVYTLSTSGTHEYYANGYEVHNKPSETYCIPQSFTPGPTPTPVCSLSGCAIGTQSGPFTITGGSEIICSNIQKSSLQYTEYSGGNVYATYTGSYYIGSASGGTDAVVDDSGGATSPTLNVDCATTVQ